MFCSLGNSGVGKTSLILQLSEGQFVSSCGNTLGLDFTTKTLKIGDERIVFQLWDTAGQERYEGVCWERVGSDKHVFNLS